MDYFLYGLQEDLREEVFRQKLVQDDKPRIELAREINKIFHRRNEKSKPAVAAAIEEEDEPRPKDTKEDLHQMVEKILSEKFEAINRRPGNNRDNRDIVCRYCNKKGHRQDVCRKRISEKAPCKTRDGKTYYPRDTKTQGFQ